MVYRKKNINSYILLACLTLFVGLFLLIPSVSAIFSNVKHDVNLKDGLIITPEADKYPAIQIKDWFGLGAVEEDIILREHSEYCGENCYSIFNINTYSNAPLIDSIKFYELKINNSGDETTRKLSSIDYKIYIQDGTKDVSVENYSCIKNGKFNVTTGLELCDNKVDSVIDKQPNWVEYTIGKTMPKGNYTLKLEGIKDVYKSYDWIITTKGIELIQLAPWVGGTLFYDAGANNGDYNQVLDGTRLWTQSFAFDEVITIQDVSIYVQNFSDTTYYTASLWLAANDTLKPLAGGKISGTEVSGQMSMPNGGGWLNISLGVPTTSSGTNAHYAIALNVSGSTAFWYVSNPTSYANGTASYSDDNGANWADASNDMSFRIYVATAGTIATTLSTPINGKNLTGTNIFFNSTVTLTSAQLNNATLYIYNLVNGTNLTFLNKNASDVTLNVNWTITLGNGNYKWNVQAWGNDSSINNLSAWASSNYTFQVDNTKPSIVVLYPTGLIDHITTLGENLTLNYSITDANIQTCKLMYGGINRTINCYGNSTINLTTSSSLRIWANDSMGNENYTDKTWDMILENSRDYNITTYQTALEHYSINVTAGAGLTAADFIFNGNKYATTQSGQIWSNSLSIPTALFGNKSLYWNFTYSGNIIQSPYIQQNITPLYFNLCNDTNNINTSLYINYSFEDEVTTAPITASFSSMQTNFWLGDGSVTKLMTFSNASLNPSYPFCLNAPNRTFYNNMSFNYASTGYPSRSYYFSSPLTNTTTNVILYLLSSSDGIYTSMYTIDSKGASISGVVITVDKVAGANFTFISQATTDAAGVATFFLNPISQYRFSFDKVGCTSTTATITPTASQYSQAMSCGGASDVENYIYTSQIDGIMFNKYPPSGITNPGIYNFSINVYSARNNLVKVKLDIVNLSLFVLNTSTINCPNATTCGTSKSHLALNGDNFKGRYYVDIGNGNGWILLEGDAYWRFITSNISEHGTLKDFFTDLNNIFYTWGEDTANCGQYWNSQANCESHGCKYINSTGYAVCIPSDRVNKLEYSRIALLFLVIAIAIAFINMYTGIDTMAPGMAIYIVGAIIWLGSLSGGLTGQGLFYYNGLFQATGIIGSYASNFINNYILAFTSLFFMVGHYLNAHRRYT